MSQGPELVDLSRPMAIHVIGVGGDGGARRMSQGPELVDLSRPMAIHVIGVRVMEEHAA